MIEDAYWCNKKRVWLKAVQWTGNNLDTLKRFVAPLKITTNNQQYTFNFTSGNSPHMKKCVDESSGALVIRLDNAYIVIRKGDFLVQEPDRTGSLFRVGENDFHMFYNLSF